MSSLQLRNIPLLAVIALTASGCWSVELELPVSTGVSVVQGNEILHKAGVRLFGEIFEHNAVDIHDPASSLDYRWCIQGGWKLILPDAANVPDAPVELYNVLADPYEKKNTAQADPDRVARLRELIDGWWSAK